MGSRGGPGGLPPGLGHGVQGGIRGDSPPVYAMAYKGGPRGLPHGLGHGVQGGSGGACPWFRPQHLELTHFVTGCYVFCGFSCISQPIYPTQNPLFPNRSR